MKKMLAVMLGLILIMLCTTGCARGNQVTHYVDESTFEVELYPNSVEGQVFASGLTAVQIVLNTPNVELGTGELQIFKASNDERIARFDARMDAKQVFMNSGNNPAYAQIVLFLPDGQVFEAGESYYVTMDEKFLYVDDIKGFLGATEKGEWEFTIGNYGVFTF